MNEQPESPKPISAPAETSSTGAVVAWAMSARPAAYMSAPATSTRIVP